MLVHRRLTALVLTLLSDAQSGLAPLLGPLLCMGCLPALHKCASTSCSTHSSPNTCILVHLISHLRAFRSAQLTSRLLSFEPGGQRCLLVFSACAVRGSYRSCLPGQSLHSLRVAASCFISPAFLALGTMPYLVLDFMGFFLLLLKYS